VAQPRDDRSWTTGFARPGAASDWTALGADINGGGIVPSLTNPRDRESGHRGGRSGGLQTLQCSLLEESISAFSRVTW
jgi:hypothetical protein